MKSSLLLATLPLALAAPRPVLPVELRPQPYGAPSSSAASASPSSPGSDAIPNSPAVTATVTVTEYLIIEQNSGTTVVSTVHDYGTAAPGAVTTTEYVMVVQLSETTFISTLHDYGTAVSNLGTAAPWIQDPPVVTTADAPCTDLTTFVETLVVPLTHSSAVTSSAAISSAATSSVVTLSTAISSAVTSSAVTLSTASSSTVTSSEDIQSVIEKMTAGVTTTYVLTPDTTAAPTTVAPAPTTVVPTDAPLTTLVVVTVTTENPTTEAPTTTATPTSFDSALGIHTIWPSSGLPYWEVPWVYCLNQPLIVSNLYFVIFSYKSSRYANTFTRKNVT